MLSVIVNHGVMIEKKSSIEFQIKDIYDQSACENQTKRSVK